jgi:hypothetical protein
LAETRIVADRVEIVILANIAEVAIAQLDRATQGLDRQFRAFEQRIATGEVVVNPQDIHVVRRMLQNAAEEGQLEIDLILIGHTARWLARGRGSRAFVEVLAWLCHRLPPARGHEWEGRRIVGASLFHHSRDYT